MSTKAQNRHMALIEASNLLRSLKKGDSVEVTSNGKTSTMTVQRELGRPDGFGSWDNSANVQVGYGPGRYNTEVSAARIADGYISLSKTNSKE